MPAANRSEKGSLNTKTPISTAVSGSKAAWQDDIAAFKAQRKPYLLYEE